MLKNHATILLVVLSIAAFLVYTSVIGYGIYTAAESKIYWCRDFQSKEDAQKSFDSGKENYAGMDADGDNLVCEKHKFPVSTKSKPIQVK